MKTSTAILTWRMGDSGDTLIPIHLFDMDNPIHCQWLAQLVCHRFGTEADLNDHDVQYNASWMLNCSIRSTQERQSSFTSRENWRNIFKLFNLPKPDDDIPYWYQLGANVLPLCFPNGLGLKLAQYLSDNGEIFRKKNEMRKKHEAERVAKMKKESESNYLASFFLEAGGAPPKREEAKVVNTSGDMRFGDYVPKWFYALDKLTDSEFTEDLRRAVPAMNWYDFVTNIGPERADLAISVWCTPDGKAMSLELFNWCEGEPIPMLTADNYGSLLHLYERYESLSNTAMLPPLTGMWERSIGIPFSRIEELAAGKRSLLI